jgi:hypothetical protein
MFSILESTRGRAKLEEFAGWTKETSFAGNAALADLQ